jgi:hypothetical protein
MRKLTCILGAILIAVSISHSSYAQRGTTFTGTAIIYGSGPSTRTITRSFSMIINGRTPQTELSRYLRVLDDGGQDALLREIDDGNFGRFALSGSIGVPLNVVVVDRVGEETRIRAVFKRWIGFGELRRGLRSVDYPFSYVELRMNPRTGRGDGTFIPAARVRFRGGDTIEVEDFGTFPGRLMGVRARGGDVF